MINIVIPMAGKGSRFSKKGFKTPKPLISIHGKRMIEVVINNLRPACEHRFIFLCLKEHIEEYNLKKKLAKWSGSCKVISVDEVTEGAACTVLLAKQYINNNFPLMIANSDQWVDININDYLTEMKNKEVDGWIMSMTADDPKWSFIKFCKKGKVVGVVEKQVISNEATVGIYNFKYGKDFIIAAEKMISNDLRVRGEFYVAPVYDQLIQCGKKIGYYNIGSEGKGMYGLGTPQDMKNFIFNKEICYKAIRI